MSNDELLQKLTLGSNNVERITVEFENEKIEGCMRPLTSGELTKLKSLEQKGFLMKIGVDKKGKRQTVSTFNDIDVNAGEFQEYQAETMFTAVAWSLSVNGSNYTKEDIMALPNGIPELLFQETIRISNLTESDLTTIKQFRN